MDRHFSLSRGPDRRVKGGQKNLNISNLSRMAEFDCILKIYHSSTISRADRHFGWSGGTDRHTKGGGAHDFCIYSKLNGMVEINLYP